MLPKHLERNMATSQLRDRGIESKLGAQKFPRVPLFQSTYSNDAIRYPSALRAYHHGVVIPLGLNAPTVRSWTLALAEILQVRP
jgi:dTDP-4-amino-4,6-dideoxygalactose transaminase